ncbi:putative pentatricopeptide repeat-containing protein At3g13770, mitochondrial [Nymphaea colorata]|uniref:DYW domain-containing protein n=1 Tax=Nymphaea colorata TaxID=210225 RepID=A0A5K0VKK8_9MAGN|nr:putative pentatricopeptide repeat-containing protein At3g13770, mitochondrial [Nymphaea colorata]
MLSRNSKSLPFLPSLKATSQFATAIIPNASGDLVLKKLCASGLLNQALLQMAIHGHGINFHGYDSVLTESITQKSITAGKRVHAHMIKTHYLPPVYLRTRLIVMYVKSDHLEDARKVFERMLERNVVTWTALMTGYAQKDCGVDALVLFVRMLESGVSPNEFTLATVLTGCTGPCGFDHGRQIHAIAVKTLLQFHIFVGSSLLDMYAKAGQIDDARMVFEEMPERDVVSCTAIIAGYSQLGLDNEALELFRQLLRAGMQPNYVTHASLLNALAGLAALEYGKQVHGRAIRSRMDTFVVLKNSLIDMYAKSGCVRYARQVFDRMTERTVISWNAMLVGYSKHGLGNEVVKLFELMQNQNVRPDGVTYLAVLSGCSHGGMVEEGLQYFDFMVHSKVIEPETEHYGCVVDLLGRSGQVDKAVNFILQMPFEPTPAIWGSLLGACRVHANVVVGEYVAKKLFEIEPQNAGNYVIMSNIYAAAGQWKDVTNVRYMMKEKAVMKEPGRSWVKLNRVVHTFHVGDKFHPQREEIYDMLGKMTAKIKEAGYVPDLSCVLHDVDHEQKEQILLGHSEKLAIAFCLINSAPGSPIQIVKNLRICVDCHNAAKQVSRVYEREILLRDNNRFHRMVNGVCSCGDYW